MKYITMITKAIIFHIFNKHLYSIHLFLAEPLQRHAISSPEKKQRKMSKIRLLRSLGPRNAVSLKALKEKERKGKKEKEKEKKQCQRNPGKTLLATRRHPDVLCSSMSTWLESCLFPIIAMARWRAHSRRFCAGAQSGTMGATAAGAGDMSRGGWICADAVLDRFGAWALAISMAGRVVEVRAGALKMRRPGKTPLIRLEIVAGCSTSGCPAFDGVLEASSLRASILVMYRSRRTMAFVMGTGQMPAGNTLCLHMGHSDELLRRKVSMQSGWKM